MPSSGRAPTPFCAGSRLYRHHDYARDADDLPILWQQGSSRLVDYGPEGGAPLLAVPSLINRAYVLDLLPELSLLRHLSRAGLRPLLLDWGRPGPEERGFDLTDYIAGRLEAAAAAAVKATGRKLALLGYCMGGLLAVALAQRRPDPGGEPGAAGDALGFPCRARGTGAPARRAGRAAGSRLRAPGRGAGRCPAGRSSSPTIR